jgi:sugar phosphate isomerase/epimerase
MKTRAALGEELPRVKKAFPFRLGATSYILPADLLTNIRFLGPFLDEVELVLFESRLAENLPSRADVREMRRLADRWELTYNVHLPTDVYLGDANRMVQKRAHATILKFYERVLPLEPVGFVLHLDRRPSGDSVLQDRRAWLDRMEDSLSSLLREGLDRSLVSVENLDYPLEWIQPLIRRLGMRLCLDIGHLLVHGRDLHRHFCSFMTETTMIHLHGVQEGNDHRSVAAIDSAAWDIIRPAISAFNGSLSVEVFSLSDLQTSLERLEGMR